MQHPADCVCQASLKISAPVQAVKLTIPACPLAAEVAASYAATHGAVDQYITNTHNEWFRTMDADIQRCLDAPLLLQVHCLLTGPGVMFLTRLEPA